MYLINKVEDMVPGKVIFPLDSIMLTIFLHISLQDLQTEAHATTCFSNSLYTLTFF